MSALMIESNRFQINKKLTVVTRLDRFKNRSAPRPAITITRRKKSNSQPPNVFLVRSRISTAFFRHGTVRV